MDKRTSKKRLIIFGKDKTTKEIAEIVTAAMQKDFAEHDAQEKAKHEAKDE